MSDNFNIEDVETPEEKELDIKAKINTLNYALDATGHFQPLNYFAKLELGGFEESTVDTEQEIKTIKELNDGIK